MKFKEIDPTKCSDCGKELTYHTEDSRFGKPVMALCADCMIKTSKSFITPEQYQAIPKFEIKRRGKKNKW